MGAFVDELVGRHGHDQHVAELPGGLQVANMADVQKIEHAVAMDDDLGPAAIVLHEFGEFFQRGDLVMHYAPLTTGKREYGNSLTPRGLRQVFPIVAEDQRAGGCRSTERARPAGRNLHSANSLYQSLR